MKLHLHTTCDWKLHVVEEHSNHGCLEKYSCNWIWLACLEYGWNVNDKFKNYTIWKHIGFWKLYTTVVIELECSCSFQNKFKDNFGLLQLQPMHELIQRTYTI